jgi:uncharacterized protein (TIGR03435 family)
MKSAKALLCVLFFSVLAAAQTTPSKPAFVSATVKPSAQPTLRKNPAMGVLGSTGLAAYYGISLKQLIGAAYDVTEDQVSGPAWLNDPPYYDIMAKMPAGASVNDAPKMLQTLLEDRFKLVVHTELKNQQVMALVVAKGGPKLQPATPRQSGMTMEEYAAQLTALVPGGGGDSTFATGIALHWYSQGGSDAIEYGGSWKVIVDQTGLKGEYQVPPPSGWIFTLVQKYGLKLQLSTRKVVGSVVVDYAEKPLPAN